MANMQNCSLPVSLVDATQAKDLCPYLNLPDNFAAAVEEGAGILAASKAVTALQVQKCNIFQVIINNKIWSDNKL